MKEQVKVSLMVVSYRPVMRYYDGLRVRYVHMAFEDSIGLRMLSS